MTLLPKRLRYKMALYGDAFLTACQRKKRFDSWSEAENAALLLQDDVHAGRARDRKSGPILAYRCEECRFWHIAHYPRHWLNNRWSVFGLPTGSSAEMWRRAIGTPSSPLGLLSVEDRHYLFVELAQG